MGASYDGLSEAQHNEFNRLMSAPLNTWPPALHDIVQEMAARYGLCGEVFAEAVGTYVRH